MKKEEDVKMKRAKVAGTNTRAIDPLAFNEVLHLIQSARQRAYQAVNTELVTLYWQVGEYISRKLASSEWGDGVVDELARYLAQSQPGLRGFTRRNLFRMRQFYECYRENTIVSPLVTQLPWTHHLIIMGQCKREEEREFYIRLSIREKWGKRELERPAIGLLLCASKDSEVVEYALSRSLSPALIAEYQTLLPDKKLLQSKLHEFYQLLAPPEENKAPAPPRKPKPKAKRGKS